MGHPLIEQFCRASQLHPDFLRRCQRVFRAEVQPLLEDRERLLEENASLRADVERLTVDAPRRKREPVAS